MSRHYLFVAFVLGAAILSGCTHTQLRWNTVRQSQTLSEVYQNQVLNNLAKFVHDPNALPDFSFPNAGASIVRDSGDVGFLFNWLWVGTGSTDLKGGISRSMDESWTLTPVTDPRKLELMRCAYQRAVASRTGCPESAGCPDCEKLWNLFYFGTEGRTKKQESELSPKITSDCLGSDCWFHVGCKKHVPKGCPCSHVGHYCGVYVWVTPGHGTDELAKLTLAILDYAVNEPATSGMKEVTATYKNVDNTIKLESWEEKYLAPADAKPKQAGIKVWGGEPDVVAPPAIQAFPGGRTPQPGALILPFEQQRRALAPF